MCVHKNQVIASSNFDLVLEVYSDCCYLGIEFFPRHPLPLLASSVNGTIGPVFCLSCNSPLKQMDDAREVVQRSRRSVVDHNFTAIDSRILLVSRRQYVLTRL